MRFNGVVNLPFFALMQSFWVEERYQILSISPKPPHSLGVGVEWFTFDGCSTLALHLYLY